MKITAASSALYSIRQAYALDAAAIAAGTPGILLMKRAGRAAFNLLKTHFSASLGAGITVYCGSGNNAGDGYILAGLAASQAIPVRIVQVGNITGLSTEARQAYDFAVQERVSILPLDEIIPTGGVIVDALLGLGLRGSLRPDYQRAIRQINDATLPVLALDVPSGLNADTGHVPEACVQASLAITFIGLKQGLVTGRGPAMAGEIVLESLDIDPAVFEAVTPDARCLQFFDQSRLLTARAIDAHKGDFGHVMIIGGDTGYGGAALMAAEAAARTGAGLVSLATRPEHIGAMLARRPEVMAFGVVSGQELEPLLARPTVLVVGPGLGRSPWSEQMLQQAMTSGLPMIVDADALNIIAAGRVVPEGTLRKNWLLTPHPGEAARLLGCQTADIQQDRFSHATALQQRYGGTVILKGAGSLVVDAQGNTGVVTAGNPGMATGGMGDILSGLLGGLLAQGISLADTARLGASLHAEAADLAAAETGERSLLATDLLPWVCELLDAH